MFLLILIYCVCYPNSILYYFFFFYNLTAPPKNTFISITPSSVVKEGDDVQIQCISEAYPSPWLVLMVKTEHGLISRLESEDGRYNITKAEEKNTGTYICESTNVFGQQTAEAALTIQSEYHAHSNIYDML